MNIHLHCLVVDGVYRTNGVDATDWSPLKCQLFGELSFLRKEFVVRKSRFSVEQIMAALKQVELGLNTNVFANLDEAREIIEAWRRDSNESRPHMAFRNPVTFEFARQQRLAGQDLCDGVAENQHLEWLEILGQSNRMTSPPRKQT